MSYLVLKSMLISNAMQNKKRKKKIKLCNNVQKIKFTEKSSICRTCNVEPGSIPMFNNKEYPNLLEDILHFSGVVISETDTQSKTMCQNCLMLLKSCVMFRVMCQNSNKDQEQTVIKKEPKHNVSIKETNYRSDDSYNIPSPEFPDETDPQWKFSEENDTKLFDTDTAVWKCEACNTEFMDEKDYNKHLSKCKIKCNGILNVNVKSPTKGTRRFLCDICGKTTHSNANLLAHMFIHENVFNFKCDLCPYQGRTQDLLNVHKRTHLPEKPYKCKHCSKTTTTSSNLSKHMRHVHSTTRPHKCNYCDKAFSYQHDMKRHVRDIHLRQSTVQCDVCFKKFNTKKILQGHRWKIHKIKGDKQGRMPSYLQCRTEDTAHIEGNGNCEPQYNFENNKDYAE